MRYRSVSFRVAASLTLLWASPASGQTAAPVPIPAPADTTLARISGEIVVPDGFDVAVYAAPPHLTYPTCLQPGDEGVLYVCTDPNLLFGRARHLGRVLRFVDDDDDGVADHYTVFADSLDAVRGIAYDGDTVYLMHAPTLAAYRDTDGDGVADERRVLVEGLGFGLDDRNGDHTANGLRLGIDGWIYVAVGDYGFLAATGADGTQLAMRAGGVLRVRPDGSELEIVARGTRNIYDIALDPQLRIFARDNTNNGQGWNSRFHYLPTGADAGYPSLFRNFAAEAHAPVADLGAGAATTTLWADHPALPPAISGRLLSADWALNRVYTHELSPRGATFELTQAELMEVPRPIDLEVAPDGSLYIASLSGGSYDYVGEHVGYVLRLRGAGAATCAPRGGAAGGDGSGACAARHADPSGADETALVDQLLSGSGAARVAAQQEILRREPTARLLDALRRAVGDPTLDPAGRTAAIFTLKQLLGEAAHPALVRAADDPRIRAMALRALADRRGQTGGVPQALLERALEDPDARVRLEAITALGRTGGPSVVGHLLRAALSADPAVAHVARNAVMALGAGAVEPVLALLDSGGAAERAAALQILARMHSAVVVRALEARAGAASGEARRDILAALARLHHREGYWAGEWWGNQPSTEGPYFDPVRWEESARIRAVLVEAVEGSRGEELDLLVARLEREGVLPREAGPVLRMAGEIQPEARSRLIGALVGGRQLRDEALVELAGLAAAAPGARVAVLDVLAALNTPSASAAPLLTAGATDPALDVELRARALTALARLPAAAVPAFAAITAELPSRPPLLQSWRRFVNDRARPESLDGYAAIAASGSGGERVLGYAVLVQTAALPRNPADTRERAAGLIRDGWNDRSAADALVRAIELLGVEDRYEAELAAYRGR